MWHLNTNKDTTDPVSEPYMNFGKTQMNVYKKQSQQEQSMKVTGRQVRKFTRAFFFPPFVLFLQS